MKKNRLLALTLSLFLLLSLCACGAASSPGAKAENSYMSYESFDAVEMTEAAVAAPEEALGLAADDGEGTPTAESGSGANIDPDKIIYSASATVETTEFDSAVQKLEELVRNAGGFVESSSVSGSNYSSISRGYASTRYANYTLRIPSEKFQSVMESLSTLGNVPYSSTYSENITAQYYDTASRLKAYETQEQTLLEMLEKAETVSDLLEIQSQLSDVRYHIESLQSTLNNFDRQVNYSTIDLSVQEVRVYTPEASLSYGQRLWNALTGGLRDAGDFFANALVWLVGALPMLLALAVLVFVIVKIVKAVSAKKKARKEAKMAAQNGAEPKENKEK